MRKISVMTNKEVWLQFASTACRAVHSSPLYRDVTDNTLSTHHQQRHVACTGTHRHLYNTIY